MEHFGITGLTVVISFSTGMFRLLALTNLFTKCKQSTLRPEVEIPIYFLYFGLPS